MSTNKKNMAKFLKAHPNYWKDRWVNDRRKLQCRSDTKHAVRDGKLVKLPCKCGETKVQAHHEDYDEPLNVEWMCQKCHSLLRRKELV